MKDFRDLSVWEKAHQLALTLYNDTKDFPSTEKFGLTNQIRRAGFSIPTNIAEGCGRTGDGELGRYLDIAMGSASETEYLLLLSRDLGFMKEDRYKLNCTCILEIKRMLSALLSKVKTVRRFSPSSR